MKTLLLAASLGLFLAATPFAADQAEPRKTTQRGDPARCSTPHQADARFAAFRAQNGRAPPAGSTAGRRSPARPRPGDSTPCRTRPGSSSSATPCSPAPPNARRRILPARPAAWRRSSPRNSPSTQSPAFRPAHAAPAPAVFGAIVWPTSSTPVKPLLIADQPFGRNRSSMRAAPGDSGSHRVRAADRMGLLSQRI
jgi:hypothetical protein